MTLITSWKEGDVLAVIHEAMVDDRVQGFFAHPPKRCISRVGRSALEPIKREVIADSHLWAKPKKT